MVKNLHGGTGTKSLARKHQVKHKSEHIRLPEYDEEKLAYVEKMLGNGMCEVITNDNLRLIAHIRNKFRGRQKRHNTIIKGMIILVGLRTWESTAKNCDVLTIYDDNDIKQIKNKPDICMDNLIRMQLSGTFFHTEKDAIESIEFSAKDEDEDDAEYDETINKHIPKAEFNINITEEIDIDDI